MKEAGGAECGGEALFEDLDFPSDDTSLFSDSSTPIAKLQADITWQRPQEICQSPALFPDNINLGHAKQGLLGDCWFLCACAFLLKSKHLLNKVLPPDQPQWGDSRYRGSFQFRFWQQGHWTEVTIDDRLPCINSTLCFSRCHSPTAFWVALLEKAYAKLHGSYERLWAGQVSEALVDLTGGVAERWSLGESEEEQRLERDSDQVRRRRLDLNLLYPVKDECALSCSTHSSPGGASELGQYHALTVMEWLDVKTVSGSKVLLLRIRNPWGRCCWGGAWMGSGVGWRSVDPVSALDLQARAAEGEFWLDETNFLSQFDDVTVGYPINDEGHLKSIYTGTLLTHNHQLAGRWMRGHTAGGSRNSSSYGSNPKFWLKVCERGEVLVSLLQHRKWRNTEKYAQTPLDESNNATHQHYQAIALHMWKVEKRRFNLSRMLNKPPCASTHCHAYQREVVLHGQLEPGYYLLIPSTYQPGAEARFLIRAFSSTSTSLSALKSPAPSLPLTTDGEWETSYFRGSWVEGQTAGGSRNFLSHWQNPCFPFSVCDESAVTSGVNVRITLHQSRPDTDLHPIAFHIYKDPEGESEQTLPRDEDPAASCVPHCYTQDVSLACCLPPGAYTIVPSTYHPDCSAHFTLSLARRIHRKVVRSQERLGSAIQEISHISVMQS
ncbi:calpain-10 isoform X1 [Etheostoma spectabile]|uniref:calpain-10 isoform X1 n=1 Tax=Etheostoma spectabile TaxID=54343 RepID=UPI0013AEA7C7|nr:calpain-10 isoform X1 [Etheostoma spectabile]